MGKNLFMGVDLPVLRVKNNGNWAVVQEFDFHVSPEFTGRNWLTD